MSVLDRYPPPGRLISVNGRHVHIVEDGKGSPTVVFESGMGGNVLDWTRVMAALPGSIHRLAYDRAGLGWSDPGSTPRSPVRIVEELEAVLHAAGIEPPYVFVGHSMGCRYVRLFTASHQDDVAGLVLVDGYHESWDEAVGADAVAAFVKARIQFWRLASMLRRMGIIRVLGRRLVALLGPDFRDLPLGERARYVEVLAGAYALSVATDELRHGGDSSALLRNASLGDLPTVVIAHGLPFRDSSQERAWQDSQMEIAERSTEGRLVRAAESAHSVMIAEPDVVVEAIAALMSAAAGRGQQRGTPDQPPGAGSDQ